MSIEKCQVCSNLPADFDGQAYLDLNPDVRVAGIDPRVHFLHYGRNEGRPYKHIAGAPSDLDFSQHTNAKTKRSTQASHENIWPWIAKNCGEKDLRVLEIGSRSVISDALWKHFIPNCVYTGLDVHDGLNVDVVGDAHKLSEYFHEESFDLIISFAVFEHLAMPWIVAEEISKVIAPGGHVAIETHFSFSEHEQPWHFFQFNSNALETMFCSELGFDVIDSGLDTPIVGRFSKASAPYLRGKLVTDLYCHSSLIAKKIRSIPKLSRSGFDWRSVNERLSKNSDYPLDSDMRRRRDEV